MTNRRAAPQAIPVVAAGPRSRRSPGVDVCKIVGALAVFTYHFVQDYRGETGGAWAIGWLQGMRLEAFATWGVCLFVTVSGLTLGWSYADRSGGTPYWRARLRRIYPTYWWVAIPLTVLAAAAGRLAVTDYWKAPVWWAGANFVSPATFWPVVDSWWYIGLAMQLYLAFVGFVWLARRQWGVPALAALCAAAPFVYVFAFPRAGALAGYLESWFIGLSYVTLFCAGFLLSRLVAGGSEVAALGAAVHGVDGETGGEDRAARGRRQVPSYATVAGLALAATSLVVMAVLRERWIAQPAALAFVVLLVPWRIGAAAGGAATRAVAWLAGLSFVFYLSHSPWAKPVLGALSRAGVDGPWVSYAACLATALAVALCFWVTFGWTEARLRRGRSSRGGTAAS